MRSKPLPGIIAGAMSDLNGLPLIAPKVTPELDPAFRPAVLANRHFRKLVNEVEKPPTVDLALERLEGSVSRFRTRILPETHPNAAANFPYLERLLKFLLWSRGASRLYVAGPRHLGERLQAHYQQSPTGRFDAEIMGTRIYERPFEVVVTSVEQLPPEQEAGEAVGYHLDGCRIGFDLGASDRKVAAVQEGRPIFSEETPWDPQQQTDPEWHYHQIMDSLRRAAEHLPRVDGIGGSAAGVYVQNRVKVASLFRGVPSDLWQSQVKTLFERIREAWNGVPLKVVNDGEVTALAGAMHLQSTGVLGIAMGSSEAAGYVNPQGKITPWLNELAFAPVDYNPTAPIDEWSQDYGCGVQYFSQQAVNRLLPAAGIDLPADKPVPEKLVDAQNLMAQGDERADRIFQTIGAYLGYGIAHYADFYDIRSLLVLGRVTSASGGERLIQEARRVLQEEFPEIADQVRFHQPDETEKRHGQAVAAASLPPLHR